MNRIIMLIKQHLNGHEVRFLTAPNGKPVVIAADVIFLLKGNKQNTNTFVKNYIRDKWVIEMPNPNGGRPVKCIFEPGVYQLCSNPFFQSEFALEFQDWLFEKVLPTLAKKGLATAPIQNETVEQYKERDSKLLELNSKLLAENKLLKIERDVAIEDRDQMGFEYVTHIVKDVFGIPMKQYDRGMPVNKTYLQVLEGIEKHFNNLNLLGHNQVIESLSAKEKLLSSWVDECEHIQRCQLKTKWQRHHNFWKFVQFYISTRGKKKVREGLMNWLSHVNIV